MPRNSRTSKASDGAASSSAAGGVLSLWIAPVADYPPSAPEAEDGSGVFPGLHAHPGARKAAPQYLEYLPG